MQLNVRQIGPCFAGEVTGLDLTKPLSDAAAQAIHDAMDEHAVLVFPGQQFDDAGQIAFTEQLGEIEHSIGAGLRKPDEYRLPTQFADVSNLDKNNQVYGRTDRRRLFDGWERLRALLVDPSLTDTAAGTWLPAHEAGDVDPIIALKQ